MVKRFDPIRVFHGYKDFTAETQRTRRIIEIKGSKLCDLRTSVVNMFWRGSLW
jgi:hypothetical protein